MKIFVAGASGAIGKQLVPLLVASGHEVVGTTRTAGKATEVRAVGAPPGGLHILAGAAVGRAVSEAAPDVIVHQATGFSSVGSSLRNVDKVFSETHRLRTTGTDNLLAAAKAVDTNKLVAQSFAGWPFAREGGPVKDEDAPLDPRPPTHGNETLAAIRHLEGTVTGAAGIEGIALRYGAFYGPGTSLAHDGEMAAAIRRRLFPVVGEGGGFFSFLQIEDAARAT